MRPGTERGHVNPDGRWESDGIVGSDGVTLDQSTAGDLECVNCDRVYRPEPGDRGLCCICTATKQIERLARWRAVEWSR